MVHGIPGLTVDVCVNGAKAITDFEPGDVVSGVRLPGGEYRLKVTPAGEPCSAAVLSAVADLAGGRNRNYTVVANLDDHGTPNLALFRNNTRKTEAGEAALVVRHTADAPAVNVWANGSPLNRGRQFVWGDAAPLRRSRGRLRSVRVAGPSERPGDRSSGPVADGGHSYQVYAWGNGDAGYGLALIPLEVGEKA